MAKKKSDTPNTPKAAKPPKAPKKAKAAGDAGVRRIDDPADQRSGGSLREGGEGEESCDRACDELGAHKENSPCRPGGLRYWAGRRPAPLGCGAGAVEFGAGWPSTVFGSMSSIRVPSGSYRLIWRFLLTPV